MLSTTVLIFIFVFVLIQFIIKYTRRPSKFPPGPPILPLVGSLPFLRGEGVERLIGDHLKQYGDVAGFYIGSTPLVLISNWKLAKELFAKDVASGRTDNYATKYEYSMTPGEARGIVFTSGQRWSSQRSFCMRHLRNFGFAKKHLDSSIVPQANEVVKYLEELSGGAGEVRMDNTIFTIPVLNVIWHMILGTFIEREDKELQKLLLGINDIFSSKTFALSTFIPWIRFIFPTFTGYIRNVEVLHSAQAKLGELISEHKRTLDKEHPRDLVDTYLIEMEGNESDNPDFSVEQLIHICFDLMAAGSETTSTTLLWTVEYMALNPEVQEKCYQEISSHFGSAEVTLAEAESLQYCLATIAEVQRLAAVAATSIAHRMTEQTELEGYILPKDCHVFTNIQHFMTDPKYWEKPQEFNPDRFLNEKGEFFKPEYFVPLSHGKRICMGESLAKAELNVFFVTLIQHFKFASIPGRAPDLNNITAEFTRIPNPYSVYVTRR